jgi:hypothetical protein
MRKILFLVLAVVLLSVRVQAQDSLPDIAKPTEEQFQKQLAHSTLAVYHGEQKCAWTKETIFIFTFDVWECKFEEAFVCTATVVAHLDKYAALTAGHCFDWKDESKYYVADNTVGKPAFHKVQILKLENDERYDYALISFDSLRDYKPIAMEDENEGAPAIGTRVENINFSYGIVKEYAEGRVVSELIQGDAGGRCPNCKGRYLVSVGLGPGASGSAVVDIEKQEIVGLAEAIFPGTQMPTLVMPMGNNFANFVDDDSAGLKPLPEGPKPKESEEQSDSESGFGRMLSKFFRWFFIL